MSTKSEIKNAVLKGLGMRPTRFLIRWCPTRKNPFELDLLEILRCETDGGIVTLKSAQSPVGDHLGHKIKSPGYFSIWEFLKVQLRIVT